MTSTRPCTRSANKCLELTKQAFGNSSGDQSAAKKCLLALMKSLMGSAPRVEGMTTVILPEIQKLIMEHFTTDREEAEKLYADLVIAAARYIPPEVMNSPTWLSNEFIVAYGGVINESHQC